MTTIDTEFAPYAARRIKNKDQRRYRDPGHLARSLDPRAGTTPALDLLDRALVELMAPGSPHNALAISMPPQEGKSEKCARRFPEWLLDHDPSLRIAIVSYELDLALRWGRETKQDIAMHPCRHEGEEAECTEDCGGLHISIRRDSSAAGRWETPQGGGIYSVGIGGPLTGKPVDVLIIDDPVKDRAAAESETLRNAAWGWWESVALTRLAPSARVVLIQTRWHEDDLSGRIFARPSPLTWRRLTIPAIATGDDDPLGRAPGEELGSVRGRAPGHFLNLRATMSAYVFAGVYQQNPVAPEGNFFRRQTFRYWRELPPWSDGRERIDCEGVPVTLADTWRFVTMDFAASTKHTADYTVAAAWAIDGAGNLILLDRQRRRVPDHEHFAMAEPLLARWDASMIYVESGWWSKTFVTDARDRGLAVAPLLADKDKVTRAIPAAGRVHAGKVWFPAETSGCRCGNCQDGRWLDEWCDELAAFSAGTHDDQVDVLAYAARVQVHDWTPPRTPPKPPGLASHEAAVAAAIRAATGDGDRGINPMNVPYLRTVREVEPGRAAIQPSLAAVAAPAGAMAVDRAGAPVRVKAAPAALQPGADPRLNMLVGEGDGQVPDPQPRVGDHPAPVDVRADGLTAADGAEDQPEGGVPGQVGDRRWGDARGDDHGGDFSGQPLTLRPGAEGAVAGLPGGAGGGEELRALSGGQAANSPVPHVHVDRGGFPVGPPGDVPEQQRGGAGPGVQGVREPLGTFAPEAGGEVGGGGVLRVQPGDGVGGGHVSRLRSAGPGSSARRRCPRRSSSTRRSRARSCTGRSCSRSTGRCRPASGCTGRVWFRRCRRGRPGRLSRCSGPGRGPATG